MRDLGEILAAMAAQKDTVPNRYELLLDMSDLIVRSVGQAFACKPEEVAILLITADGKSLRFVAPRPFADLGTIPLTKRDAIAVRVLAGRSGEVINNVLAQPPAVTPKFPWSPYGGLKPFESPDALAKYPLEYNPAKANQLLDDLGFARGSDGIRVDDKGNKMSFVLTAVHQPGQFIYEMAADLTRELKEVGIEATMKVIPEWGKD